MIAPRVVGYASGPYTGGAYAIDDDCVYQLHTHDNSGIVHVEPQTPHQTFTLAQFFDIWGQPLSSTGAAGYTGTVRVFRTHLDGGPSETREVRDDPRAVTINERPHDDIAVQVGPPWALLPRYAWYPRSPQSGAIVLAKGGTIGKWGAPTRGAGSRPSPRRRLVVMLLVIVLVGCAVEAFVALRRRRVRPRWA
jgi:hypothetical protein